MDDIKNIIMNSSLLTAEEKLGLLRNVSNGKMEEKDQKKLIKTLKENEGKFEEAENEFIHNMSKIYFNFLDKNISQLQQGIMKLKL